MTHEQIVWASQYDWFVGRNGDGSIMVRETLVYRDGTVTHETFRWTGTFVQLRVWAGY